MSSPCRIAVVGVGKIARDQHLPVIAANPAFDLVATVDPQAGIKGVPNFASIAALLADGPALHAVTICTPPAIRPRIVAAALAAGLDVMMEKPPAITPAEVATLRGAATAAGRTLFAAWHSREAHGVATARDWLAGRRIDSVGIEWREDIRRWHPGQDWILGKGGFGVFDPGINALSILTAILSEPVTLIEARIDVPAGRQSPIAAALTMQAGGVPITAAFDFLQTGPQTWDIVVETADGTLRLGEGGRVIEVHGVTRRGEDEEYPRLYRRFAALIATGESDVDDAPLRLVTDALDRAGRVAVAPFHW